MTGARRIASADEAIEVAAKLAAALAQGADQRDRERRLPLAELDELSASGLLGITVPAEFGGAEVPVTALTEVFRLLAVADASLAQIPHSHVVFLNALQLQGTRSQQEFFFAEALAGKRFANAQSERGGRTVTDDATTLRRGPEGQYELTGEKFYCTGALFAHWLVVRAVLANPEPAQPQPQPVKVLAYLPRDAAGVTVIDDWDGLGQRTTASGTVRLHQVSVPAAHVVPYSSLFDRPSTYGSRAQVLHAALDAGLARGALQAAVAQVARARPWFEAAVERASDDPLVAQQAGELEIAVRAAEALLARAAESIDAAEQNLTDATTAAATLATAVAKVAAARACLDAGAGLFDLGGTRSASALLNLSRFWRDARTHTLHDPVRWKVQHVGRWLLNGIPPPRHGLL